MIHASLPGALENSLTANDPEAIFAALLPALGGVLQCDRCFLYLRHPETRIGKVVGSWRRSPKYPDVTDRDWKPEPASLAQEDPLFAAALRAEPSIFVEDVETADPKVVNQAFEHQTFGHRALIHAHLRQQGQLWGILQPCVFEQPRRWSAEDRALIGALERRLTASAVAYVQTFHPPFSGQDQDAET